jgi:N-acyl homoserine lactone hydrolase
MLTLRALTCGWFQAPVSFFIDGGESHLLRCPIPVYLIEHPQGRALFDTGLGRRFQKPGKKLTATEAGFEFDATVEIGAQLQVMGIDPRSIRWIINSHLHADHCGGNASIPNATVVVQGRELAYAKAKVDGLLYHADDFETGHSVLAIDGEYDLFKDGSVVLFPTYGHTAGHQCARLKLARGDVVLAADCCYLRRSLDELRPSPGSFDAQASGAVLRHLANLRDQGVRIFYGHDGEFWRSVPQNAVIT